MEQLDLTKILNRKHIENEILNFLNNFEKSKTDISIKRGLYLYGVSGIGKTYLIKVVWNEKKIIKTLANYNCVSKSINIINTQSVVSNHESPLTAVKSSKNTSMWNCIEHQLQGKSDISLSAGNTGVLLVISRMILKMMNNVSKPALAALWPNNHGMNIVLDLGANIECNDRNLVDFAELGSALFKSLFSNQKS